MRHDEIPTWSYEKDKHHDGYHIFAGKKKEMTICFVGDESEAKIIATAPEAIKLVICISELKPGVAAMEAFKVDAERILKLAGIVKKDDWDRLETMRPAIKP